MSALSLLVIAVIAQPLQQRVEVHGGASTFWYASVGNRWDQVRGDVLLDARRSGEGVALARLMVSVLRGDELWTVELSQLRPDEMVLDADLEWPSGPVHAAVALRAKVRVTRSGEVLTETARLQAFALTTGLHADDGTFRMLPQPRSADLELLLHLEDVPGQGSVDIGFDRPEIWLDGAPVATERAVDATALDLAAPSGASGSDASAAASGLPGSGTSNPGPGVVTAAVAGTSAPTSAATAVAPTVGSPLSPAPLVVASPWKRGGSATSPPELTVR